MIKRLFQELWKLKSFRRKMRLKLVGWPLALVGLFISADGVIKNELESLGIAERTLGIVGGIIVFVGLGIVFISMAIKLRENNYISDKNKVPSNYNPKKNVVSPPDTTTKIIYGLAGLFSIGLLLAIILQPNANSDFNSSAKTTKTIESQASKDSKSNYRQDTNSREYINDTYTFKVKNGDKIKTHRIPNKKGLIFLFRNPDAIPINGTPNSLQFYVKDSEVIKYERLNLYKYQGLPLYIEIGKEEEFLRKFPDAIFKETKWTYGNLKYKIP